MKKTICCILACVFCLSAVALAEYNPGNLKFGFYGGFNLANVSGHEVETKHRTGYALGGFIDYQSSDRISYRLELLFNGKGYKIENAGISEAVTGEFSGTVDAEWILSYLEMPVLAKVSMSNHAKYRPYLIGGGFMSYLIRDKLRLSDTAFVYDYDIDDTKKADAGFILGIGIDLKAGENGWVFFESRYELSMLGVIKNQDQKSRAICFRAGYWF